MNDKLVSKTTQQRVSGTGICVTALLFQANCAQMPTGPSVAVKPGPNKPFEIFMQDDQLYRGWASHSIGLAGNDAAAQQMLASTVTGAAMGTVVAASVGANQATATAWDAQRRYDIAHQQCMYSKGNLVSYYGDRSGQNMALMWAPPAAFRDSQRQNFDPLPPLGRVENQRLSNRRARFPVLGGVFRQRLVAATAATTGAGLCHFLQPHTDARGPRRAQQNFGQHLSGGLGHELPSGVRRAGTY